MAKTSTTTQRPDLLDGDAIAQFLGGEGVTSTRVRVDGKVGDKDLVCEIESAIRKQPQYFCSVPGSPVDPSISGVTWAQLVKSLRRGYGAGPSLRSLSLRSLQSDNAAPISVSVALSWLQAGKHKYRFWGRDGAGLLFRQDKKDWVEFSERAPAAKSSDPSERVVYPLEDYRRALVRLLGRDLDLRRITHDPVSESLGATDFLAGARRAAAPTGKVLDSLAKASMDPSKRVGLGTYDDPVNAAKGFAGLSKVLPGAIFRMVARVPLGAGVRVQDAGVFEVLADGSMVSHGPHPEVAPGRFEVTTLPSDPKPFSQFARAWDADPNTSDLRLNGNIWTHEPLARVVPTGAAGGRGVGKTRAGDIGRGGRSSSERYHVAMVRKLWRVVGDDGAMLEGGTSVRAQAQRLAERLNRISKIAAAAAVLAHGRK